MDILKFKDKNLDKEFYENGYVKFQILTKDEILEIRKLYDSLNIKKLNTIYSNIQDRTK